jgi:hypothetical protein
VSCLKAALASIPGYKGASGCVCCSHLMTMDKLDKSISDCIERFTPVLHILLRFNLIAAPIQGNPAFKRSDF